MADVRVSCINKVPRDNPHEGITHIGGTGGNGWKWTREQAVQSINNGTNTFYVQTETGLRADIGVVNGQNGPYLRTYADGNWTDNLLALPECPS